MLKFTKKSLFFLLVLLYIRSSLFVFAEPSYDLYICGHQATAKIISRQGELYVSAEMLANDLGLSCTELKHRLIIGKKPFLPPGKKLENITPPAKVFMNGYSIYDEFRTQSGEWFISLIAFSQVSDNMMLVNQKTRIVDLIPWNTSLSQNDLKNVVNTLNSTASNALLESEKNDKFAEGIAKLRHALASQLNGGAEPDDLPTQIRKLHKSSAVKLKNKPAIDIYLSKLEKWFELFDKLGDQIQASTMEMLSTGFENFLSLIAKKPPMTKDNNEYKVALQKQINIAIDNEFNQEFNQANELTEASVAASMKLHSSFLNLSPPMECQQSHTLLKNIVEQFVDITEKESKLMPSPFIPLLKKMTLAVLSKDKETMEKAREQLAPIAPIEQQLEQSTTKLAQDLEQYMSTLKLEIQNLPKE